MYHVAIYAVSITRYHRLILLRHADSQQTGDVKDHDRPITQQGREAASKVAALLQSRGWLPDLVICSNALRTRQTLEAMQHASPDFAAPTHKYFASLYTVAALDGQTRRHIAECITGAVAESVACVMCVGHNKGWEEAATSLAVRGLVVAQAGKSSSWIPVYPHRVSLCA